MARTAAVSDQVSGPADGARVGISATLGEDTDALLEEIGYGTDRIAALRSQGAVG